MSTSAVNLTTSGYVLVSNALRGVYLQSNRDTVRIALADDKPDIDTLDFHPLSGADDPLVFESTDTSVWALATSDDTSLVVTEFPELEATKTIVSQDTDTGVYTINTGTFQSIGLSLSVDIDFDKEDIRVEVELPSVTGSTGNATLTLGLFIDNVLQLSRTERIGNTEIAVSSDIWRLRDASAAAGTFVLDVRARNDTGTATVDNSVDTGASIIVDQRKDVP